MRTLSSLTMAPRISSSLALITVILVFISQTSALTTEYCSSLNTADTAKNSSIFQSNGLCYNFCIDDYAFAVLQDEGCWCSDYAPGSTVSTSECDTECPGYPSDLCGGDSLYGYIALTLSPSGTVAASSSTKAVTTTSKAQATTVTETQAVTVLVTATQHSTTSSSTTTSYFTTTATTSTTHTTTTAAAATTSKEKTTTSHSTSSTWTPTPVTSLETVTGQVRTVTITPTSPPSSSDSSTASKKSSGITTGAAVGLTIGLVALVALIAGIVFFYLRKKRKEMEEEKNAAGMSGTGIVERKTSSGAGSGGGVSRTLSENSKYMLGTDGRQVVEGWDTNEPGSRRSRLIPIDPRLDPYSGVYSHENKSRESINTIRDNHDYSRKVNQARPILRATNPDDSD